MELRCETGYQWHNAQMQTNVGLLSILNRFPLEGHVKLSLLLSLKLFCKALAASRVASRIIFCLCIQEKWDMDGSGQTRRAVANDLRNMAEKSGPANSTVHCTWQELLPFAAVFAPSANTCSTSCVCHVANISFSHSVTQTFLLPHLQILHQSLHLLIQLSCPSLDP